MFRASLLLAWIFVSVQLSAQFTFRGTVTDESGNALVGANVYFDRQYLGTITDTKGQFVFRNLNEDEYNLNITYIGYGNVKQKITIDKDINKNFSMEPSSIMGDEVIIRGVRADKRDPVAFTEIDREEIRQRNLVQDMPYLLSLAPSVVTSSDAGHGVGYTGLRVRGTAGNRINITVDGIPLNDAESHGVWFVNMPDFASSVENVQIQRGVGTSTNGSAAFGASLNFQTNKLNPDAYGEIGTVYGSYNTMKNNVKVGTGLLNDHFSLDVRLSRIHTDGYIDRAFSDLKSFYVSAGWYSEKSILKLNILSGKEKTYQAWDGVPGYMLEHNRTYNGIGEYTTEDGETRYYDNETDNYNQDHYHLHYTRELGDNLFFNAALHYTLGEGYYEQYKEEQALGEYLMPDVIIEGDTITETDLIRRKWLDNDFYGGIFSLNYKKNRIDLKIGGGINNYAGDHFGTIVWARYASDSEIRDRWYENLGEKLDYNVYTKLNYILNQKLNLFGDLQLRGIEYSIDGIDDDLRDISQKHNFLFLNPKAGINYSPDARQRAYFSFAVANREPNRTNFVDADPNMPLPQHETLYDYETGYFYRSGSVMAGVNMYYMDYDNQLVLTGEINDIGSPIMTNVKNSYRMGIELQAGFLITDKLKWNANLTLSRNKIQNMVSHVDNWDYWNDPVTEPYQFVEDLGETDIAFSPSVVGSGIIDYTIFNRFNVQLHSKYVGKQYIDNTSNENRKLDPYFINDLRFSYSIDIPWAEEVGFNFMISNLFDVEYESNAWIYRYVYEGEESVIDGYYPQAGIHFFGGVSLRF